MEAMNILYSIHDNQGTQGCVDAYGLELTNGLQTKVRQRLIFNTALSRLEDERASSEVRAEEVKRQLSLIEGQRDELLNLRLAKVIPEDTFDAKQVELQERETLIRRQVQLMDALRNENDALAARAPDVFWLIQQDWDTLNRKSKHDILRLLFGGFVLDGKTLVPSNGTPLELFRVG